MSPARKNDPFTGVEIVGVGGLPTVIGMLLDSVELAPSDTRQPGDVRPADWYVCVGLACVDVPPSPNVQL